MPSPALDLYRPAILAGAPLAPEVADSLFTLALADDDTDLAERLAAQPGSGPLVSERARTHSLAKIRAAWLSNPDRTTDEVVAAIAADRASASMVRIAQTTADQDVLAAVLGRANLKVLKSLAVNQNLSHQLIRDTTSKLIQRSQSVPSLLRQRAELDPVMHDQLLGHVLARTTTMYSSAVRWPAWATELLSSPYVTPDTFAVAFEKMSALCSMLADPQNLALARDHPELVRRFAHSAAELASSPRCGHTEHEALHDRAEELSEVLGAAYSRPAFPQYAPSSLPLVDRHLAGDLPDPAAAFTSDLVELRHAVILEPAYGPERDQLIAWAAAPAALGTPPRMLPGVVAAAARSWALEGDVCNAARLAFAVRSAADRLIGNSFEGAEAWERGPLVSEMWRQAAAGETGPVHIWPHLFRLADDPERVLDVPVDAYVKFGLGLNPDVSAAVTAVLAAPLADPASLSLLNALTDGLDLTTITLRQLLRTAETIAA